MSEGVDAMNRPFIWAHRGASAKAPENTLAAFSHALADGADGLELDIHLSRDGIPVVLHDDTLERTTDGCGPVSALTLRQLQRLDAGRWFDVDFACERIPTLESVLRAFGGQLRLNLEIKDVAAGMAVIEMLDDYPAAEAVLSSFNLESLRQLRTSQPELPLAVLYESGNRYRTLKFAETLAATAFHPRADHVSRPLIHACKTLGLPVYVWTVDNPVDARALLRSGVDGLFTNDPAVFLSL